MSDEIVCEKKEVYIHEPPKDEVNGSLMDASKIGGRLQILKNKHGVFLQFLPYGCESTSNEDWTFIIENSVFSYSKENKDETENISLDCKNHAKYKLQMNLNDLSSVRRVLPPNMTVGSMIFMQADGHTWPQLHFHKGGSKEFLNELSSYLVFKKDLKDPRLYLVQRENPEAFRNSIYELSLFQEQRNDVVKKFMHQPIQSTLMGFSKVTNLFRDVLKPNEGNAPAPASNTESTFYLNDSSNKSLKSDLMKKYQDNRNDLNDLMESMTNENIHLTNKDGYEMVTRVELGPMPKVLREKCVDKSAILADKDGRILEAEKLVEKIFRGGIDPSLRVELWKYLLRYYSWNSTAKSRHELRIIKENDYYRMKTQWKTMSEDQKSRFSLMRERENLIDKDVQRTDRTHPYFVGDDNENLTVMREILMTYNMYDFNLGYVQGMSDLLAPIMVIMDNEVDSFWCLVGYMEKIGQNFVMDQAHIKSQLADLKTLIEFVDSNFSTYLQEKESSNMYFCFRWILILFKREFSFPDIMKLWEILWTDKPCKNFHLLICISILLMKKDDIVANQYGFNEILKFVNDMSLHIDLDATLKYAEGLYLQLSSFKNLPASICEILGLPVNERNLPRDETELADLSRIKSTPSSRSNSRSNLNEISESEGSKSKPATPSKRN